MHVMPLGNYTSTVDLLGYFNNFRDMQGHIIQKLLFQMDLHILLTTTKQAETNVQIKVLVMSGTRNSNAYLK